MPNFSVWRKGNIVHVHETSEAVRYAIQPSQAAGLGPSAQAVYSALLNVRDLRRGAMCNIASQGVRICDGGVSFCLQRLPLLFAATRSPFRPRGPPLS